MIEIPLYKSTPTMRNYEDYISEYNYTKGWNDAMDFIFPEAKKERERESIKKNFCIVEVKHEREAENSLRNYR